MVRQTPAGTTTFDEFMELIREHQKADLLDGVLHLASPENAEHNDLLSWLTAVLRPFIEERKLGRLTISRMAYRLSERTAPEPDLAFVAAHRIDRIRPGYVDGPPDLAVEIVSPDSVQRDYEEKRRRYEAAGVLEYWIIDPLETTATFLVRKGGERRDDLRPAFVDHLPREHLYQSRVLAGFELDVRWLWQRPLPPTMPIVRRLLGET